MLDIVLEEGGAFGAGTHPTTRTCLELMLAMAPEGSFADLGCGSGVLAILAGLLGFSPLTAVDVQPASVEATRANAARAGVTIDTSVADLSREPAPPARSFVANVPPAVHAGIAGSWRGAPEPRVAITTLGLAARYAPGRADLRFGVGPAEARVTAAVTIATLRSPIAASSEPAPRRSSAAESREAPPTIGPWRAGSSSWDPPARSESRPWTSCRAAMPTRCRWWG
jgi:hypothetical protein